MYLGQKKTNGLNIGFNKLHLILQLLTNVKFADATMTNLFASKQNQCYIQLHFHRRDDFMMFYPNNTNFIKLQR